MKKTNARMDGLNRMKIEEIARKFVDTLYERNDLHNVQDVLDAMASIIEDDEDFIGNFTVAQEYYLNGDKIGYLKSMYGEDWDFCIKNGENNDEYAERMYNEDKEYAEQDKIEIARLNKLANDGEFLNKQIGSNCLLMKVVDIPNAIHKM